LTHTHTHTQSTDKSQNFAERYQS